MYTEPVKSKAILKITVPSLSDFRILEHIQSAFLWFKGSIYFAHTRGVKARTSYRMRE